MEKNTLGKHGYIQCLDVFSVVQNTNEERLPSVEERFFATKDSKHVDFLRCALEKSKKFYPTSLHLDVAKVLCYTALSVSGVHACTLSREAFPPDPPLLSIADSHTMRIIAGHARGLKLSAPPRGSSWIRPTTDRVKESLFNLLCARIQLHDRAVLDLFSGTGALGCEALSRGAASVVFVDKDPRSIRLIRDNLKRMRAPSQTVLQKSANAALRALQSSGHPPFDLVLLDPPYPLQALSKTLHTLHASGLLASSAWIAAEHSPEEPHLDDLPFDLVTQRAYGSTRIALWSVPETPPSDGSL